MRDVFKYFKYARSVREDVISESTTSERAHELGYEYQSRGVWLDPQTGKKYRAQGTQFREIEVAQPTGREPAAKEEPTAEREPEQQGQEEGGEEVPSNPQVNRIVAGGPTAMALASGDQKSVEKQLSRGREKVQSAERKAQIKAQAAAMIAADRAKREAEAAAAEAEAEAPEGLDDLLSDIRGEEPEQKTAEDFPTIDDKMDEIDKELDDLDDDEAFETEYERFTQEAEATMKDLAGRQRKIMEEVWIIPRKSQEYP